MEFLHTTVTKMERPGPDYALIAFAAEKELAGAPGQFVMARGAFGTDPILPRAFSLVSAGKEGSILVKAVGKATRRLSDLREGDPLMILGPLGNRFSPAKPGSTPLLVAGGVGVAPLIFMSERLSLEGVRPIFLYGGRTAHDILYRDRISKVAELIITTEDGSLGEKGRVTDALPGILDRTDGVTAYSCGPEPMLKALHHALPGAPLEVALEQAMACGMGTCKGCAVHDRSGDYKYVCSDGPVFGSAAIFGGNG